MRNQGFTLVEMGIVLAILGLLLGGILAGQNLIRASQVASVPKEIARYNSAITIFKDEYGQLPGDFDKATRVWGAEAGAVGTGNTTACDTIAYSASANFDTPTCNGNGDGLVAASWRESFRAWEHLANAGLVEGRYSGMTHHASDNSWGIAGINIPPSKADSDVGYLLTYIAPQDGTTTVFAGEYGNTWRYGAQNGMDELVSITAAEAWNIDKKMDDGRPGKGSVRSYNNTARPNCADSDNGDTAEYQYQNTNLNAGTCNLLFLSGF